MDKIERVCNPDKDEGEWVGFPCRRGAHIRRSPRQVAMVDLAQAERGAPIKLEAQEYLGECRRECRTVEKSCRFVFDERRAARIGVSTAVPRRAS